MAVEEAVVTGQEAWRNFTHGLIALKKFNHRSELIKDEVVGAGRVLHISPLERRLNQEQCATPELDPFQNGYLVPVRLLDDEPDNEILRRNPNVVADNEIGELLAADLATLNEHLDKVTNPITLERMLTVAIDEDVSVKRAEAIRSRLAIVRGAGRPDLPETVEDSREVTDIRVPGRDNDQPRVRSLS